MPKIKGLIRRGNKITDGEGNPIGASVRLPFTATGWKSDNKELDKMVMKPGEVPEVEEKHEEGYLVGDIDELSLSRGPVKEEELEEKPEEPKKYPEGEPTDEWNASQLYQYAKDQELDVKWPISKKDLLELLEI